MAFSFGTQNKTGFGTTTTASTGFGFGGSGTTATTGFGTGTGFGTATTGFGTAPTTGFGTGAQTGFGTGATTGGFGTAATTASGGLFGATPGTTSGGLFGAGGASTGFGGAATGTTSTAGGLFGGAANTGFGTGTGFGGATTGLAAGTSTTGFGAGSTLGGGLTGGLTGGLATTAQPAQQNASQAISNMARAVSLPTIFGDERDAIIAKWNQLQAFWGTGKGYFSQQGESVDFAADNPFCRFKAVGYSCIPKAKNETGLVGIIYNKKLADVRAHQQQIVDAIQKLLASGNTTLTVCVEDVKALPDNKTEMIVYLQERAPTGTTRRIPAADVFRAITTNANIRQQMSSQLSVENLLPKLGFSQDQLKQYLDTPPAGIDGRIWQQAKLDNPDPERFIPVPMIGFTELHNRLKQQDQQTSLHQKRLDIIASDIANLQRNHGDMLSKIDEYKRRYLELSHRVLQVIVKQEIYRRMGYVIQADEEQLRTQLENIQAELNAPTRFKGRLNELMSQLRMQNQLSGVKADASYNIDNTVQQELKLHLRQQQDGIQHLISIIREDLDDLQMMDEGLLDINKHVR